MSPRLARLPIGDAAQGRPPLGWPAAQRGRPNVLYIVAGRGITPGSRNGTAGPWELYHVRADRAETVNLAARYPQKVAELLSLWGAAADHDGSLARDAQEAPELLVRSRPQLPSRRAS